MLGSALFAILYGLMSNLSVAIVAMVNHTAISDANRQCEFEHQADILEDGPFTWNERTQGLILGSYFWGYMVSQLPAGRMAEMFSASWVLFASAMLNIVGCLLIPSFSYLHYSGLLVLRVMQGIGGGLSFPAMHVMIVKWSPPHERSLFSAIVYEGMALGTVISLLMTGGISAALSWEATFYIQGGLSLVWCVLWVWLMSDSPDSSRFITAEERNHIMKSQGDDVASEHSCIPLPWSKIFTSMPFIAILVADFCSNFGWYLLLTQMPTYMRIILKFEIAVNGALSSLPFFAMWVFSVTMSKLIDSAHNQHVVSITSIRKISTAIASLMPCACLVGVSFAGCDRPMVVVLMTIGIMALGGMFSGFLTNHCDIAPNFAGTLIGISNTIASIPGFLGPVLVGELTYGNQTIRQWRIIFLLTAGLFLVEAVFYLVFGSGEVQPWNQPTGHGDPEVPARNGAVQEEENKKKEEDEYQMKEEEEYKMVEEEEEYKKKEEEEEYKKKEEEYKKKEVEEEYKKNEEEEEYKKKVEEEECKKKVEEEEYKKEKEKYQKKEEKEELKKEEEKYQKKEDEKEHKQEEEEYKKKEEEEEHKKEEEKYQKKEEEKEHKQEEEEYKKKEEEEEYKKKEEEEENKKKEEEEENKKMVEEEYNKEDENGSSDV